jgi:hypothetical protein
MSSRGLEVADVFRRYGETYCQQHGQTLSTTQRHAIRAIELCRTAALGGHVERRDNCAHERIAYNSCRNRNCPKCQSLARARGPVNITDMMIADEDAALFGGAHRALTFLKPVVDQQGRYRTPSPNIGASIEGIT